MAHKTPREVILLVLLKVIKDGEYCGAAINEALMTERFSDRENAFVRTVCEGTIERMIEIDYIIDSFASIPTAQMKPIIQNILRSAVYQMKYMDSVPNSAACDEAVKLAQKMGFYNLKGFVNGVLRNIARNLDSIDYPDKSFVMEHLSVKYSMPRWIVKMWADEYGTEVTERMLKYFLMQKKMTVRMPFDSEKRQKAIDSLLSQSVTLKRAAYLGYAYEISDFKSLNDLAAFRNGLIYPQDIGSMLAAHAADPQKGDTIFDLCAAPGGKSLQLADMMGGFGMVEARDLTVDKINLIKENLERTGQINVHAVQRDATVYDENSAGKADMVFCDVPCSGLGVIRRKPDIKYRRTLEDIEDLVILQRSILHNAAAYVKPGGILMYSTCTVGHLENKDNYEWFLENYPFKPDSLDPHIPRELCQLSTAEGYLQLIPGVHRSDGFFIARFKKEQ